MYAIGKYIHMMTVYILCRHFADASVEHEQKNSYIYVYNDDIILLLLNIRTFSMRVSKMLWYFAL